MTAERLLCLGILAALLLGPAPVAADPAPQPSGEAQAAHQVGREGLESRLRHGEPSPVRRLAPAIFIELSPVTASDPAVRLPEDQQQDE